MTSPDPQDFPDRLHVDAEPPAVEPGFFDSLAFSATLSTPTAGAGLAARVRKSKVAAAIGATAVLLSGAAYAGGLVGGGDGHDATPLTPTHTSSQDANRANEDDSKSAGTDDKQAVQPKGHVDKHEGSDSGSGTRGHRGSNPSTDSDDDTKTEDPSWSGARPHCNGGHGWSGWSGWSGWGHKGDDGTGPSSDGDRSGDKPDDWGDGNWGNGNWGGHKCSWGDVDWGDHDGDWGDHDWGDDDGDWGDRDWGDDDGNWRDQDWGDNDGNWGDGHDGGDSGSDG